MSASYPGALSAWIKHKYPSLVFASIASSAPVQAKYYFWEYFEPIRNGAPAHCRDSIINTVKYVDGILFSRNKKKIQQLKAQFGLPNVTHNDDFAASKKQGRLHYDDDVILTPHINCILFHRPHQSHLEMARNIPRLHQPF